MTKCLHPNCLELTKTTYCSLSCVTSHRNLKRHLKIKDIFDLSKKCCKNPTCLKPISFEKRTNQYCDHTCAASFVNTQRGPNSVLTKQKRAESMRTSEKVLAWNQKRKELSSNRKTGAMPIPGGVCFICKNTAKTSNRSTIRKTCGSADCNTAIRRIIGQLSASIRQKRSKDEIKLFDMCNAKWMGVKSNLQVVDGWDADVVFTKQKIAVLWNGPWHYREMGMKNHSLKQVQTRDYLKIKAFKSIGWQILVFEDRYFTPKSAFEVVERVVNESRNEDCIFIPT